MLIAVLFLQQAVKGLIQEFQIGIDGVPEGQAAAWRMVNGVFSVLLSLGFICCCMLLTGARKWRFLLGWVRALLADYGTPLMMVVFSGVSYVLRASPAPPACLQRTINHSIAAHERMRAPHTGHRHARAHPGHANRAQHAHAG